MPLKNFYTANDVKPGDVFAVTVCIRVQYDGTFRIYRCPFPNVELGEDGSPQGDRLFKQYTYEVMNHESGIDIMSDIHITAITLMPILRLLYRGPDPSG